jgi:hypothetical protein
MLGAFDQPSAVADVVGQHDRPRPDVVDNVTRLRRRVGSESLFAHLARPHHYVVADKWVAARTTC